mmetsp:Transcript_25397/g.55803  ORF Transcript_25397/g.55803 Transcript_25397/m.55803 type:complete len:491 (+) Transcript_25397:149-1621(+)|eukprot:CAMPEP_0201131952 /NCGR_PEP_ID=MMETSP0850-20130426/44336_1 /ASSEMBLY_ACC=CAM_ASM_000622 /TAXON_ID=183588 /ORGANISM="Pseudo-nitzschia fraudulenta, Strain WWA7" /LENGTH=490 /DNA_ID=CAMNT_0047402149 /DNA_START=137 /DNA_END=1609 /DNA_ORIENTATION=-
MTPITSPSPKNDIIVATESIPLLSKKSESDQNSTGTSKTFDAADELSSYGSHEFDHVPLSIAGSSEHADLGRGETPQPLMDGVTEELHDITEAARREIHKADEDEMYMIEMGLTRSLSVIHDDVVEAGVLFQAKNKTPTEDKNKNTDDIESGSGIHKKSPSAEASSGIIPLSGYLVLVLAIVAMSTLGPLLQLQDDTTPSMKVLWRMCGTSLLLIPLALTDLYHHGGMPKLTTPQWFTFFLSTFSFVVMSIGFCVSLEYTAVGNAVILSNSLALILLVGKVCAGESVTMLEATGAMVAFSGALLCSRDSTQAMESDDEGFGKTLAGDLLAILSAIGGVGYVTFAKTSRAHLPLYLFTFLTMSVGASMVLVVQATLLGERVTWDCDVVHGIGGFLVWNRFDRLPLELMMVVVCNLAGTMGYVRAMSHFDSLAICSVQLLEPIIAEFLSNFAGVGALPGVLGWIGNAAVAGGTYLVLYESAKNPASARKNMH